MPRREARTEVEKVVEVERLLKQASDALFALHATRSSGSTRWVTKFDSEAVLRFELQQDLTKRDFYRDSLCEVESACQSLRLFRERLRSELRVHETLCTVAAQEEEFIQAPLG